jgi:hypothetical protein
MAGRRRAHSYAKAVVGAGAAKDKTPTASVAADTERQALRDAAMRRALFSSAPILGIVLSYLTVDQWLRRDSLAVVCKSWERLLTSEAAQLTYSIATPVNPFILRKYPGIVNLYNVMGIKQFRGQLMRGNARRLARAAPGGSPLACIEFLRLRCISTVTTYCGLAALKWLLGVCPRLISFSLVSHPSLETGAIRAADYELLLGLHAHFITLKSMVTAPWAIQRARDGLQDCGLRIALNQQALKACPCRKDKDPPPRLYVDMICFACGHTRSVCSVCSPLRWCGICAGYMCSLCSTARDVHCPTCLIGY